MFGVSRVFLPCFGLSRRLTFSRAFWPLYMFALAGSHLACLSRFVAGVFTLSRVAVCRCCRLCRFVCVCDCVAVCLSLQVWQALTLSGGGCQAVRRSNKCSIRGLEQVFRTNFRRSFLGVWQNFQPNPDRIFAFCRCVSNRILTEPNRVSVSQPNRIRTESWLRLQPNLFIFQLLL